MSQIKITLMAAYLEPVLMTKHLLMDLHHLIKAQTMLIMTSQCTSSLKRSYQMTVQLEVMLLKMYRSIVVYQLEAIQVVLTYLLEVTLMAQTQPSRLMLMERSR